MTYCVAIKVNDGLVFTSDTRTSAGVDDVRTYNKMHVFEYPGERVFVLMSAGNLATTQSVLTQIRRDLAAPVVPMSLMLAKHMYDAAEYVGSLSVNAQKGVSQQSQFGGVDLRATLILGGQIAGEEPALYMIYPEGNCIASSPEMPYLQIGENKYGKPILDRIIHEDTSLEDAARCALVSLDSTMRSNISVGPPLDLSIIRTDGMQIDQKLRLDLDTPFYASLKESWARNIAAIFTNLPRFEWESEVSPQQDMLIDEIKPDQPPVRRIV
ncbi:peptidase [Algiphilus sp. W345]|uniref:Peptidase n=1 Tax=Banduia mediterranea TaxID=3075609 RepID=A0ABU2WMK4_9GAMM|nr:peptidase [Algiphilus sp. W345]MDT0499114.1 peptidase [Algiphilus sp. W345]